MVIHAIGDSHVKLNFGGDPRIVVHHLGPVTMRAVSRDGRNNISPKELGIVNGDSVIWCFGEIDVRCHIIRQRDILNENISSIVDILAMGYINSILDIQHGMEVKTIILGVIPPTDLIYDANYPRIGALYERVWARNTLNKSLENYCILHDFIYLDPYKEFTDGTGALISNMSDGQVHVGNAYAYLVVEEVMRVINQ
jgi:hypothetical protein